MTLSRKDQAKINYLNSPEGRTTRETMNRHDVPISQLSDTVLPDDFVFDGWKVVEGKYCKTVAEYKAALVKSDNSLGGWSG